MPPRALCSCGSRPPRGLADVAFLQKANADLISVHPDQLATPEGRAGRREQQEEFLEVKTFHRAGYDQPCATHRHIDEMALAAPGAVNAHHQCVDGTFKRDTCAFAIAPCHRTLLSLLPGVRATRMPSGILAVQFPPLKKSGSKQCLKSSGFIKSKKCNFSVNDKHGEVASSAFDLEFRPDRPDVLGPQRRLRPGQPALVPWHSAVGHGGRVHLILHGHTP